LKLIFHLEAGKVQEFSTDKTLVSIGRGNNCDVVLPYEGFSRRHAQIECVQGEIFVTDLGSTNGVYIDGERIPVNERTPMQSYLNLQVGPAHQIEVIDTENLVSIAHESSRSKSLESSRPKSLESSRPKSVESLFKDESPKSIKAETHNTRKFNKESASNKSKDNKLTMLVLPLLVFGGVIYYYMVRGEEPVVVPTAPEQIAAPATPLSETTFLKSYMLESLERKKSCVGDLASWCTDAGILDTNKEGVLLEGKSLIVYMNMGLLASTKYSDQFEALDQKKRLEILLLRRAFQSVLIRNLTRQSQIDNVQIVGGIEEGDQLKLKVAVKIRRDIDPIKSEKFSLYHIFDLIFNVGEVDKLSEISSLYEKLPIE
jgi:pSer/pThr/pTyr-binding forkhead associated (FHA) protein